MRNVKGILSALTRRLGMFARVFARLARRGKPAQLPPATRAECALGSIVEEMTRCGAIFVHLGGSNSGPEFWEVVGANDDEVRLARIECELAGVMALAAAQSTIVPIPGAFVGPLCAICERVEAARVHLGPDGHDFVPGRRPERRLRLRTIDGVPTAIGERTTLTFLGTRRQWARPASGRAA